MKLCYFKDKIGNFGDDLNPWIWSELAPGLIDGQGDSLVGIGTILGGFLTKHGPKGNKVVFSSGTGIALENFKLDDTFTIKCVRGPLTAKYFDLDPALAITDGAALLSTMKLEPVEKKYKFSYMPHKRRLDLDPTMLEDWTQELGAYDINVINTKGDMHEILKQIRQSECILAEAMHGAIVADTLRIPWIPIVRDHEILKFKWDDWCESLEMKYEPHTILPIWKIESHNLFAKTRRGIKNYIIDKQIKKVLKATPNLSQDFILKDRVSRLEEKLEELVLEYKNKN